MTVAVTVTDDVIGSVVWVVVVVVVAAALAHDLSFDHLLTRAHEALVLENR